MRYFLFLFVLLLSYSMAGLKINGALYGDKYDFYNKVGAAYAYLQENEVELSAFANYYRSKNKDDVDLGLNLDIAYNQTYSPFVFLAYKNSKSLKAEYGRLGVGVAWLLNQNILVPPYRNKVSFAFIVQSQSKPKLSLRYKLKGYWQKIGFKLTAFWVTNGKSVDLSLKYKLKSNIDVFWNFNYQEEKAIEDHKNLIGIEVTL